MSDQKLSILPTNRSNFATKRSCFFITLCLLALGLANQTASAKSDTYAKTRFPIVMVPGALSFDNILGVVDYWYAITDELRQQGADIYVTNLSSSSSNNRRGEELLEDIRKIRALTGASRVNLIAHSQGGPSARYVASLKPEWIESVTCVTCMNEGTEFADNLYSFVNKHRFLKFFVNIALSTVFSAIDVLSTNPKDGAFNSSSRGLQIAEDLVQAASTEALSTFNKYFPEALSNETCEAQNKGAVYMGTSGPHLVNNVSYFSWGGTSTETNQLDPIDGILIPVVRVFYPLEPRVWDGLVRSCGHPLGTLTEGFYPINHFDAINQVFGLIGSGIDIPSLYAISANRLVTEGH